jgi:hypothetical protein
MYTQINSLPTLLPFRRGEPIHEKRMTDVRTMSDRNRLKEWVEEVAEFGVGDKRGGSAGLFGKLLGG